MRLNALNSRAKGFIEVEVNEVGSESSLNHHYLSNSLLAIDKYIIKDDIDKRGYEVRSERDVCP